jgi:hypothetical protein
MTDYYALLGEPRLPWLDAENLKSKFLARSATLHPDRVHNLGAAERDAAHHAYTALNAAYTCLREPKDRLRHWLELELGCLPKDLQRIPSDLMDLSLRIGETCRQADSLTAEKERTASPLLQVQLFQRGAELTGKLQVLQGDTHARCAKLLDEVRHWSAMPQDRSGLARLEEIYRLLSYFTRWQTQLQERLVRLFQ